MTLPEAIIVLKQHNKELDSKEAKEALKIAIEVMKDVDEGNVV